MAFHWSQPFEGDFEPLILLPQVPEFWDYRCEPSGFLNFETEC